ncbi:MAG TPA: CHAT domain-containing protein [Pyrinomonadaceae bacterium]|nr:CHAT domain-containing protein [Pyrinomonadaceae bacterium]
MPNTVPEYVAQVSNAVALVESRRSLIAELRAQIEQIARVKLIVVDGEVLQVNRLQQLQDTVLAEIDALRSAKGLDQIAQHIEAMEFALSDVRWELADSIKDVLSKKAASQNEILRQQEEIIQQLRSRLNEWAPLMTALKLELDKAAREQAPIREELNEFVRIDGLLSTIQRELNEGKHTGLKELLDGLDADRTTLVQWLKTIPELTQKTVQFKRQADLLLLQAPLDGRKLYRYTVLLRTASDSGAHGINIQEKCALVELDRKEMAAVIGEITNAVNRGVTRSFQTSKSSDATVSEAPPMAPADGNGQADTVEAIGVAANLDGSASTPDSSSLRKAELVMTPTSPLGPLYPEGLNDLVKNVGDFMYRIFMSHQMQDYLNASPCSLTVTTNDLMLPWELMSYQDRSQPGVDKFLCLERPIARMPMGRYFPRHHREHPDEVLRFLLIYADPHYKDEKKRLSAAKREVDQIEEELKKKWGKQVEVIKITEAQVTGRALNKVMREGNFKVIHFAGHAFFDKDDADLSSLLLDGNEQFLAQKVQRLLEGRPLVFLNACESGTTANEEEPQTIGYMQEQAEGLASAFIYGGARGCVGSLWPIYDKPAADFAVHFYNNVVRGYMIGEALRLARLEIKNKHDDQITWAAYVLYGDPTLRL